MTAEQRAGPAIGGTAIGRRYVFAPLEQRGMLLGLRGGQLGALTAALLAGLFALRADPGAFGAAVAVVAVACAAAVCFVPVAGRSIEQWTPAGTRFMIAGALRRRRVLATDGRRLAGAGSAMPALRGVVIEEHPRPGQAPVAVVRDATANTWSAVLAVRGRSFALLDAADKERRLQSWAGVLSSLARDGGPIRGVQWIERTAGGDSTALQHHLGLRQVLAASSAPTRSYAELIGSAGPLTQDHECFVVLTVRGARSWRVRRRRAARRQRTGFGRATPVTVLLRELRLLESHLNDADIDVHGALDHAQLLDAVRISVEPDLRGTLAARPAGTASLAPPWPVATDATWSAHRADAWWHATFWIAEWPRSEVGPDFLSPLLLGTAAQRTVAMVMSPVAPSRGFREAEAARTAVAADDELRRRAGFIGTARRRREAEGLAQREAELADGHAAYAFSGFVTVSARDEGALEDAAAEVVQAAHQCRLELRRLYGIQDLAFTWTLPLGRGLP